MRYLSLVNDGDNVAQDAASDTKKAAEKAEEEKAKKAKKAEEEKAQGEKAVAGDLFKAEEKGVKAEAAKTEPLKVTFSFLAIRFFV